MIFAVAAIPLLGAAGLALDYMRWHATHTRMQNVADAAALAGVNTYLSSLYSKKKGKSTAETSALTTVNSYVSGHGLDLNAAPVVTFVEDPPTVDVALAADGRATLSKVLGTGDTEISVRSVATTAANDTAACVIGLAPTAAPAVNFKMSGSFVAEDCAVWSNSTQATSMVGTSSGSATASKFCAAGGVNGGLTSFSVAPEAYCDPIDDPLANVTMPAIGLCDHTNFASSASGTVTILPGVYCGGMRFNSSATIQLSPGQYILKDGPFTIVGGSSIIGSGITFFLSGTNSGLRFGGAAKVQITAPTSGEYAGIAIFSDRSSPADTSKITGSSSLDIEGVVYLPNHDLTFSGSSDAAFPANYTVLIARTVSFEGSSVTKLRSNFAASGVPVPQAILQTRIYPRLTE